MQIKISELAEFFKRSNKIKSNGLLPIYNYVLIEFLLTEVCLTKYNGNMHVKHSIEQSNKAVKTIMVEEIRLAPFVANAKGEDIFFSIKGNRIVMRDAVQEVKCELMDEKEVSSFKTFPTGDEAEKISLSPDVLSAIFQAKGFASVVDSSWGKIYCYQHEKASFVYATNGNKIFLRKFEEGLPEFALSPDMASIISVFNGVIYYTEGNYNFFDTGRTVYGFIKPEYKPNKEVISQIVGSVNQDEFISANKEDLLSYSTLLNSIATDKFPVVRVEFDSEGMLLKYDEQEHHLDAERVVAIESNFTPEAFAVNATYFAEALRCFQTEKVNITTNGQSIYCLTHPDEPGLSVLIAKVKY